MNTKRIAALAALIIALGLSAFGQATTEAAMPLITIENGYSAGFNVGNSKIGNAFEIVLGLGLTDRIQAQTIFIQGDGANFDTYRLLGLAYGVLPRIGVITMMGLDTTAAASVAGLGLYSNLFTRNVAGSLQTGLRLKLDYIAPVTSFATGLLRFGLAAYVGM